MNVQNSLIRRLALFLLPIFATALYPAVLLYRSGEAMSLESVIDQQVASKEQIIFGRAYYSQEFGAYKRAGIEKVKPQVLVIGSSRAMQFRDVMFPSKTFYNAGGALQSAADLGSFAEAIREGLLPRPEVCIVSLDLWWIVYGPAVEIFWNDDPVNRSGGHVLALRSFFRSRSKTSLSAPNRTPILSYRAIGVRPRLLGEGFRNDGSRAISPKLLCEFAARPIYEDRESPPVISRIRNHSMQFSLPFTVDANKSDSIRRSIETIAANGVNVVVFFPPFSDESASALQEDQELRSAWNYFNNELKETLRSIENTRLMGVLSPSELGLDDTYMVDGVHPSEVFLCEMMKASSEVTSWLPEHFDSKTFSTLTANAASNLSLDNPNKSLEGRSENRTIANP